MTSKFYSYITRDILAGGLAHVQLQYREPTARNMHRAIRNALSAEGYGRRLRRAPYRFRIAAYTEKRDNALWAAPILEQRFQRVFNQLHARVMVQESEINEWSPANMRDMKIRVVNSLRDFQTTFGVDHLTLAIPSLTTDFNKIHANKWPLAAFERWLYEVARYGRSGSLYATYMIKGNQSLRDYINREDGHYAITSTETRPVWSDPNRVVYQHILQLRTATSICPICSVRQPSDQMIRVLNVEPEAGRDYMIPEESWSRLCGVCYNHDRSQYRYDERNDIHFNANTMRHSDMEEYTDVALAYAVVRGTARYDAQTETFRMVRVGTIGGYHGAVRKWRDGHGGAYQGCVGVELEVAFPDGDKRQELLNDYVDQRGRFREDRPFLVERDGSLENLPHGCEFISEPLPLHEGYQAEDAPWRWLLKQIYAHGGEGWKHRMQAGIHVNMDASDKTPNQVLRYASFITNCSAISKFIAGRRSIYGHTQGQPAEERPGYVATLNDNTDDPAPVHPSNIDRDDYGDDEDGYESFSYDYAEALEEYASWESRQASPAADAAVVNRLDELYAKPLTEFEADRFAGVTGGFAKVTPRHHLQDYTDRGKYAPVHVRGSEGYYVLETRIFGSNIRYEGFMACVEYCVSVMEFVCELVSDVDVLDTQIGSDYKIWLGFRTDQYPNLCARLGITAINTDTQELVMTAPALLTA